MRIRPVIESDIPELVELYARSTRALAPSAYSPEQVESWASFAVVSTAFRLFIFKADTFAAVDDTGILGFAGLESTGRVASVYVRHDRFRQGIATALLQYLIQLANDRGINALHAEASVFSRPLFHRVGFVDAGVEHVERNGVHFTRQLVRYEMSHR